jgi:hypothetical protein
VGDPPNDRRKSTQAFWQHIVIGIELRSAKGKTVEYLRLRLAFADNKLAFNDLTSRCR